MHPNFRPCVICGCTFHLALNALHPLPPTPYPTKHWQLSQTQETHRLGKLLLSYWHVSLGRVSIHIVRAVVRLLLRGFHALPARRSEANHSKHAGSSCLPGWPLDNTAMLEHDHSGSNCAPLCCLVFKCCPCYPLHRLSLCPHLPTSICHHYVLLPPNVGPRLWHPQGQCLRGGGVVLEQRRCRGEPCRGPFYFWSGCNDRWQATGLHRGPWGPSQH